MISFNSQYIILIERTFAYHKVSINANSTHCIKNIALFEKLKEFHKENIHAKKSFQGESSEVCLLAGYKSKSTLIEQSITELE